jgi:D-alanyl-lipoteichoic acid acyltransferase DltB (MBOAT superfamily)
MNPYSLEFLLILLAAPVAFFLLPGTRSRRAAFAIGSLAFLHTYLPNPLSWAVLAAFLLSGYACGRALAARPSRLAFTAYLVLLVAAFAFLKRYEFVRAILPPRLFDNPVAVVGLSYMLFRQIHFLVDLMQGQIERPTLWAYLNYQLNPFTLLAGPIQRFQDFQAYWECPAPVLVDRHEALKAYMRLFLGIIKVVVVSDLFRVAYDRSLGRLEGDPASGLRPAVELMLLLYSFIFHLYFNFSGYCDVAIAGASLVGLQLPENFHYPFLARNILDYWTRWHITLGHWIRDYLFTPFYKAGAERWPARGTSIAVAGYFVAFTLAGIWHGSTWNFVVYGLLHGAGASAAKLWESAIIRRKGRPGLRQYLKSAPIRWAATAGTFHYACFTLLFFALDLDRGRRILGRVFGALAHGY